MKEYKRTSALLFIFALLVLLLCFTGVVLSVDKKAKDSGVSETLIEKILKTDGEIRGIWIATVANINFPTTQGASAQELKDELDSIIKTAKENGFNTLIFQVRPSSDALYNSDIFPTSEFLTGTQGATLTDGFDPLKYLTTTAHQKDIAVCAWVNPLRAVSTMNAAGKKGDYSLLSTKNPCVIHPEWCVDYNGNRYYDPGIPEVRSLVASGVAEIARNYEVDAIVFDDYFYPYPEENLEFDDSSSYGLYGNAEPIDDWRRNNVNKLIEQCYNEIKAENNNCYFGVSPFGIWANNNGENDGSDTKGLSAYSAIYCDALSWIEGGYIDFLSPQIYWAHENEAAPYATLCDWWDQKLCNTDIPLIVSHAAYRVSEWENSGELTRQIEYARTKESYIGSAMYGYAAIINNQNGILDCFKAVY